ncbi:HalD/BesD family halogenase [Streptomyces sp. NBC_01236]|uniref:HalD/BesD family halogenase n=1 Tax=Streptomyces sp. NBC_01236 TaxID=2903789 RepID=UPI002E0E86A2|nr:hypothetical protein OG324_26540 [Streptomyces sp. NBC_01236]
MPALMARIPPVPQDQADATRHRFHSDGYLPLPGLLTADGLDALREEARRLEGIARRRDFTMACMDGSPRHMTTLGGQVIARESRLIPDLYADPVLLDLLGSLTGERPVPVPDPLERHVLNILHRKGDTHGAHTDDYPYALVLFLEAPETPADGGLLAHSPRAASLSDLDAGQARAVHHRPGDAYLLRSDTTAHRVTPLTRSGVRRTVLNFAYTTGSVTPRATPSARELYA